MREAIHAYRSTLAIPAFRRFWLGFTLSTLGDGMTRLALTWWVYETTRSAEALALLTICYSAPIVVGGLAAGWLLDRFDRVHVMRVDNLVRGAVIGALPLLHALGHLQVWHAYVAAAVYGLLMMISLAGSPSLVPSLVPSERLATANALEMLSFTVGGIVGPPAAGILAARFGAPSVLAVDALSYLALVIALSGVRVAGPRSPGSPRPARAGLREGLLLVTREPVLRSTTLMYMAANVGNGMRQVWLPLFAVQALGGGPPVLGLLLGAGAVGEVTSSVLAGAVTPRWTLGMSICGALVAAGLSVALLAGISSIGIAALALATAGFFAAPLTIWAQTLRMRIVPPEARGRVFALLRTLMQGTTPVGGAVGGWLVGGGGLVPAILLTGGCFVAAGVSGLAVGALRRAGRAEA